MAVQAKDLWSLALDHSWIDPRELADAVGEQARHEPLDYRTRLLIRDSIDALRTYWGEERLREWLAGQPRARRIADICQETFERPGFPSLRDRLVDKTDPETVRQY